MDQHDDDQNARAGPSRFGSGDFDFNSLGLDGHRHIQDTEEAQADYLRELEVRN
jgi:hypothetical protein